MMIRYNLLVNRNYTIGVVINTLPAIKILEEMKIKEAWTIELKNGAYGGLKPIIDPFDKNRFYLSDGWGSAFPSIKLRQLSFSDGKELNSVSIKIS